MQEIWYTGKLPQGIHGLQLKSGLTLTNSSNTV